MIREWRVAGFNYAKRVFFLVRWWFIYLIINGNYKFKEMVQGLRNLKVKLSMNLFIHIQIIVFKKPKTYVNNRN